MLLDTCIARICCMQACMQTRTHSLINVVITLHTLLLVSEPDVGQVCELDLNPVYCTREICEDIIKHRRLSNYCMITVI